MKNLSYSFHVGNGKNAISNLSDLAKSQNHNGRLYDDYNQRRDKNNITIKANKSDNVFLIGDENLVSNIKKLYDKEFSDAVKEYNAKQKQPCRQIKNYLNKIHESENQHVATEIIIGLGKKEDWEAIPLENRKHTLPVFENQIRKFQHDYPNFKIAQAVVHYDENTPHMHIIGVPIGEKSQRGLSRKVQKSAVFSQKNLFKMQTEMREQAELDCQKYLAPNVKFSEKQTGRNKDYFKDKYIELQDQIDEQVLKIEQNDKVLDKQIQQLVGQKWTPEFIETHAKISAFRIPEKAQKFISNDFLLISKNEYLTTTSKLKMTQKFRAQLKSANTRIAVLSNEIKELKENIKQLENDSLNIGIVAKQQANKEIDKTINEFSALDKKQLSDDLERAQKTISSYEQILNRRSNEVLELKSELQKYKKLEKEKSNGDIEL